MDLVNTVHAHTVMVETQRHSQVAKETSAAKDATPVVATTADTNKSKHHKPKVFARQRDNYGYWNARDTRRFPPPWSAEF